MYNVEAVNDDVAGQDLHATVLQRREVILGKKID
jgi:hypothetical protein